MNVTPDPQKRIIEVANIHSNFAPDILEISIDRLKVGLIENRDHLKAADAWQTPFALFVTIVTTLMTADFKDFVSISAATWRAVFILGAVISVVWLVKTLAGRTKKRSIDALIQKLKEQAPAE